MDEASNRRNPPFWDHQRHHLRALRTSIEKQMLQLGLHSGDTVVDLGCGSKPYAPLFEALGCKYIGCDIGDPCDVRMTQGEPVPLPDASAHAVVSFQVLEHVWDVAAYLRECRRLLGPKGRLLLSTHGSWLYHAVPTDFRRWTRDGLIKELEINGFTIESVDPVMGPLAWTTQFRLLGMRHALMQIPLLGRVAVPVLSTVMNARMLLEDAITPASVTKDNASVYVVVASVS